MSSVATMERIAEMSPRTKGRIAGVFEALEGFSSRYGQVVILGKLVVAGDAAVTAAKILGHECQLWFGFGLCVAGVVFHLAWAFLFYELFKPVNRSVSLFAVFVILVCCAIQAITALLYIAPLLILQGGSSLSGFTPGQLQGLAMVFIRLNSYAFNLDLVFFGLWCALTG